MWPAKAKAWLCIEPGMPRADPERVQLRQNYFIFMENFQKNLRKLIKNQVKLTNRTPLYKFEPPIKKSWIPPPGLRYWHTFIITSPTTFVGFSFGLSHHKLVFQTLLSWWNPILSGFSTWTALFAICNIWKASEKMHRRSLFRTIYLRGSNVQRITHAHQL